MATLKELSQKPESLSEGHRLCAGCSASIAVRQVLMAINKPVVVTCATGCLEVATTIYPYTAWNVPFVHSAFENAGATISGIEAAYNNLKKKGKIDKDIQFVAFGGDGGTYDIGFQALSGMIERGHNALYVCYNNEAYMNTGIQRSGATPKGANTTTAPAGFVSSGKKEQKKNLTECIIAHNISYAAQSIVGNWKDLTNKVQKAVSIQGTSFINILSPCRLGWGFPQEMTLEIGRLAVESCIWPLYEFENGKYKITYQPKEKKSVIEWLKSQSRFAHLFKNGKEDIIEEIQKHIDFEWERLIKRSAE
ncbi:MAG: thiamine pyrophosphate-dependent enzyme [bacterium]